MATGLWGQPRRGVLSTPHPQKAVPQGHNPLNPLRRLHSPNSPLSPCHSKILRSRITLNCTIHSIQEPAPKSMRWRVVLCGVLAVCRRGAATSGRVSGRGARKGCPRGVAQIGGLPAWMWANSGIVVLLSFMGKYVGDGSEGEHDEAEGGLGRVEAVGAVDDHPDAPI
jgi:hypothetical protein